jgi:uncharacterized protein YndB with AHSA1/START domain
MSKNNLVVDRPARAYTMSRTFNAPRELVWKACTDPELLPKWWGPRYLTTTVQEGELKVGATWRMIQTDPEGNQYAFRGVYKEIEPPSRLVLTFEFEPMAGHISTQALDFEALAGGRTKLTATMTFESLEDLEGMLQSGMEGGADESWDRLEELLETVKA